MNFKFKLLVIMIPLFLLSACAAGREFTRIPAQDLKLGVDTIETIRERLGEPYTQGTAIKHGETITILSYTYGRPKAGFKVIMPNRTQGFYFANKVLVGHLYTSSEDTDNTRFDSSKVKQIKENETKIDEVLTLLGPSDGDYIYPMVEKEDYKAKVYINISLMRSFSEIKLRQQSLVVSYDKASGIVTRVEYAESEK